MLAQGDLDGAIISEPHVAIGEEAGYFNVWLGLNRCDFVPRMQWTIVVANNDALAREGDLIGAVLCGCRRSYRYAADNRDEWADFGARYFGISRDTMMKSIDREFDDLHFDCDIDVDGMEAAIALQRKLGSVTGPLRLTDILDSRFAKSRAMSTW
jgi:ABC-type nitrate/sulfonate/bicarbonate transport system substrate-binding protein